MFPRILRLIMIVAMVVACCLSSIRVLQASGSCVVFGGSCFDNTCGSSGGECGEYPACKCQHIVRPPLK